MTVAVTVPRNIVAYTSPQAYMSDMTASDGQPSELFSPTDINETLGESADMRRDE